uniref:Uncharacterized protein n=1 Tax=Steinernema glaseri TaxID=37863 RepID=A0A1I7YD09_9BILA
MWEVEESMALPITYGIWEKEMRILMQIEGSGHLITGQGSPSEVWEKQTYLSGLFSWLYFSTLPLKPFDEANLDSLRDFDIYSINLGCLLRQPQTRTFLQNLPTFHAPNLPTAETRIRILHLRGAVWDAPTRRVFAPSHRLIESGLRVYSEPRQSARPLSLFAQDDHLTHYLASRPRGPNRVTHSSARRPRPARRRLTSGAAPPPGLPSSTSDAYKWLCHRIAHHLLCPDSAEMVIVGVQVVVSIMGSRLSVSTLFLHSLLIYQMILASAAVQSISTTELIDDIKYCELVLFCEIEWLT